MNRNLTRICKEVGEQKRLGKIKNINIVSNATIVPNPELLEIMHKYGIMIMLSDYGKLSVNMDKIQKACDSADVQWRYAYLGGKNEVKIQYWSEVGDLTRQDFTNEQAAGKFKSCNSVYDCNMIYRGRYYFCSQAAFMAGLGIIKAEDNSFNLLQNYDSEELKCEAYRRYMTEEDPIDACYYCDMHGQVPAAEQL